MLERFVVHLPVAIRHCRSDDLEALEWYGHQASVRGLLAAMLRRADAGEVAFLVADMNDFPVARIGVDFTRKSHQGAGVLWSFAVMPHLQRLGIGGRLVAAAERLVRERGFHLAEITVNKANGDAHRLYERLGYAVRGSEIGLWSYIGSDGAEVQVVEDCWVMRRSLT